MYKAFNVCLESRRPIPELPQETAEPSSRPVISFEIANYALTSSNDSNWFHYWYGDNEKTQVWIAVARQDRSYLLRFPNLADFLVDVEHSRVLCHPQCGTPDITLRHLLLDQVLPRLLGHQGNLIVHASAVMLSSGNAIAFLGNSGWGKSTIASSFYKNGASILADDCLLLEESAGDLMGIPAYAGFRLWQDSVDSLFSDQLDLENVAHYSSKKRLILHDHDFPGPGVKIQAIICLNDPSDSAQTDGIRIERISGAAAIMTLIKRAFVLDVENTASSAKRFVSASRVAATSPLVLSLTYERDYDQLDRVRAAILTSLNQVIETRRSAVI